MPIPVDHLNDLEARFGLDAGLSGRLRAEKIMYDEDDDGRYLQVHARVFALRFFFGIVQRDGYTGCGVPNAPIRLARARLSRHPAGPRR